MLGPTGCSSDLVADPLVTPLRLPPPPPFLQLPEPPPLPLLQLLGSPPREAAAQGDALKLSLLRCTLLLLQRCAEVSGAGQALPELFQPAVQLIGQMGPRAEGRGRAKGGINLPPALESLRWVGGEGGLVGSGWVRRLAGGGCAGRRWVGGWAGGCVVGQVWVCVRSARCCVWVCVRGRGTEAVYV